MFNGIDIDVFHNFSENKKIKVTHPSVSLGWSEVLAFLRTFERSEKSSFLVYYLIRILRVIFFRLFFALFYGDITRQIIKIKIKLKIRQNTLAHFLGDLWGILNIWEFFDNFGKNFVAFVFHFLKISDFSEFFTIFLSSSANFSLGIFSCFSLCFLFMQARHSVRCGWRGFFQQVL